VATGKSQTSPIEEALEKLLADLEHERRKVGLKEDIMAIAADFQAPDGCRRRRATELRLAV